MEEEKKEEKIIKIEKTEEGNVSFSLLEEAKRLSGELKKANEDQRELIARREELLAREMLGGRSEAGRIEIKKERTPIEMADDFTEGKINLFEKYIK